MLENLLLVEEFTQLVLHQITLISKKNYKLIAIDLSKQKALDAD